MADGVRIFRGASSTAELFVTLTARPGQNIRNAAEDLHQQLQKVCTGSKIVYVKLHLSDISNQLPIVREVFADLYTVYIGQPPLNGAYIALEAYALQGDNLTLQRDESGVRVTMQNYQFDHFDRNWQSPEKFDSFDQTRNEFDFAEKRIQSAGGTIKDNLLRTWLYCRDIDNHYAGLVKARRELFAERGLTADTHFIASTGIAGVMDPVSRLVRMDNLAGYGLKTEQIEFMKATDYLSDTAIYGVTFERGVRLKFQDRSKYFISGTASIDKNGEIVHPYDVAGQTRRMLVNVEALLKNHGGELKDIVQAVVYLRDPADAAVVAAELDRSAVSDVPRIMVAAPVCRPGWLVEMECIALKAEDYEEFKPFC